MEWIETPSGDVILLRPNGHDVLVERPDGDERALLEALDGAHSMEELTARFGHATVAEVTAQLQAEGLVDDAADESALPDATRARFDRQLRYLSDLAGPGEPGAGACQRSLAEARVAILGVGGLGGRVALELASIGVGELWLVDGDRVEMSNLNRQIQYAETDLGLLKVERAAAMLRGFNSALRVIAKGERIEGVRDLAEFIDGADLVVDAADWPPHLIERWCNRACFEAGIPYIAMSQFPPIVRFGPLYVPGVTGCFNCQEMAYRREFPIYDLAIAQRSRRPSAAATLGPACGITAGRVAVEVMHFLTGAAEPTTLGIGRTVDLRTLATGSYEVTPEPGCAVCSGLFGGEPGDDRRDSI